MQELDHQKGEELMPLNCVGGEDSGQLDSSLDSKEIKPVNPKGNNPDYSFKGLTLKLKLQYCGPDAKSWLTGKDPDAGEGLKATAEGGGREWDG